MAGGVGPRDPQAPDRPASSLRPPRQGPGIRRRGRPRRGLGEAIGRGRPRRGAPGTERDTLSNIDLTLPPGKLVALVGENGSGKTTLIKLITRLYDPIEGRVSLDGIDVREFDPVEYRKLFSVIFQDFAKYAATANDN